MRVAKLPIATYWIAMLIICLSRKNLMAQDCDYMISGQVTDSLTGNAVPDVTVSVAAQHRSVITDRNGRYTIGPFCAGQYTLQFQHLSYRQLRKTVSLNRSIQLDLRLSAASAILRDVEVEGRSSTQDHNSGIRKQLSGLELGKTRGLNLAETLSKLPGVTMLQTGSTISKPVFHGLHSNRILTINNGVRQEGQQWGNEHAPEIDPFIADNLEIIKGVEELRYGSDAIGGVILVNPKPLRHQPGTSGELNAGYFSNNGQYVVSAMAEQQLKALPALSYRIQGTFKQGGNVNTPSYRLNNTSVREGNFSLTAGWKKENYDIEAFYSHFQTKAGIFTGSHIGNLTDLLEAIKLDRPNEVYTTDKGYSIERPYQDVKHDLYKLRSSVYTGRSGKLNIQVSGQWDNRNEFDIVRSSASSGPQMQLDVRTLAEDVSWDHQTYKGFQGTFGISAMQQDNEYKGRYLIPQYTSSSVGGYWLETWTRQKWEIQGGVRYDHKGINTTRYPFNQEPISHEFDFSTLASSLNVAYKLTEYIRLNAAATLSNRAPYVNELLSDGIHHGTATYEKGDITLQPERSINTSVGFLYESADKKLHADLSVFYNHIHDFIYQQPKPEEPVLTIAGAFPKMQYEQTDAALTGGDASVAYTPIAPLELLVKASILRAYNLSIDDWMIGMPSDRFSGAVNFNMPESDRLSQNFVGIEVPVVLRQTRVPDESIHGVQDYKNPPAGYVLLNANGGTSIRLGRNKLGLILSANNILNKRYREYLNSFRYYTDEMGRNISIRVNYHF